MRTESDLRAALHSLEREAPAPAAVLPSQKPPPPRRRAAIIAVATATALVAAAVPTYRALTGAEQDPAKPDAAKPPLTTWRYSYTLKPPAGWWQVSEGVLPEGQVTNVTSLNKGACTLFSFERGRLDTRVLTQRRPVTIPGGREGFVADVATWRPYYEAQQVVRSAYVLTGPRGPRPPQPTPEKRVRPVVAFEYAPGSWRVVDCAQADDYGEKVPSRQQAIDRALRVAGGVSDQARAVRSPFSLSYLPGAWTDQRAVLEGRPGDVTGAESQFNVFAPEHVPSRLDQSLVLPDAPQPEPDPDPEKPIYRGVRISVFGGGPDVADYSGKRLTVAGYPAYVRNDPKPVENSSNPSLYRAQIVIDGPSDRFFVKIESMTTQADYTPELVKIAKGMRLVADRGPWPGEVKKPNPGWFDADKAFPRP